MREPYFTYEYKKTSELMVEMRKDSVNFTIVLDEYGATVGMITLEDLLEEIVGDIRDEYDHDEEDPIRRIQENEYQVLGSSKLDDLNEKLGIHLESEDYDSIGGYIIEHLDHLPKAENLLSRRTEAVSWSIPSPEKELTGFTSIFRRKRKRTRPKRIICNKKDLQTHQKVSTAGLSLYSFTSISSPAIRRISRISSTGISR